MKMFLFTHTKLDPGEYRVKAIPDTNRWEQFCFKVLKMQLYWVLMCYMFITGQQKLHKIKLYGPCVLEVYFSTTLTVCVPKFMAQA